MWCTGWCGLQSTSNCVRVCEVHSLLIPLFSGKASFSIHVVDEELAVYTRMQVLKLFGIASVCRGGAGGGSMQWRGNKGAVGCSMA